ncbi:RNA polymerase sigma-70 factor (ECF subfamily) [Paenibacillus shirakamiensis]|uniref:RNA polymerase sigma-70 factor (ECF subfamily) n=1 Tax=Paenibacillus shirakamiensis TaxID=1265935 RepID=A0ABS4JFX0_9BACL|nr:sigma-70 family RNA polymerase sigma factor [Paenibacillus shirakamiensis]MBP2000600.1 RNA polymerase sigma-70 factor (ECF subfamily) [Paenibacillus shirakamiensis]
MESGVALPLTDSFYLAWRGYLLGIAYRMLGSVEDAEDIVQDLFAELQGEGIPQMDYPKAYLTRATVNRSLNVLKSARKQREEYVGQWLPDPLHHRLLEPGPLERVEHRESLQYAYLVLMEQLLPAERAVLLLHEVYQYDYRSIAELLGKNEAACRQLGSRARRKLRPTKPISEDTSSKRDMELAEAAASRQVLLDRFIFAFERHQVDTLRELLSEHAIMITDGGGKVHSAINPIKGAARVHAFTASPKTFQALRRARVTFVELNGEMQVLFWNEHQLEAVMCVQLSEGSSHIQGIYVIKNPEKLESIQLRLDA